MISKAKATISRYMRTTTAAESDRPSAKFRNASDPPLNRKMRGKEIDRKRLVKVIRSRIFS
jgi:hypothetical protein